MYLYKLCQNAAGTKQMRNYWTALKKGIAIKVSFNIKGNRWEKDGKVNYITNLDAWKIESGGAAPSNMGGGNTNAQPAYNNNNNNNGGNATGAGYYNPAPEGVDDLPF